MIGRNLDVPGEFITDSNSFSFKNHEKYHFAARFSEPGETPSVANSNGHNPKVRTAATTRIAPALLRRAPSRVDRLSFFVNGASTSRLLYAKPAAPTKLGKNEHDDPHVLIESHVEL